MNRIKGREKYIMEDELDFAAALYKDTSHYVLNDERIHECG